LVVNGMYPLRAGQLDDADPAKEGSLNRMLGIAVGDQAVRRYGHGNTPLADTVIAYAGDTDFGGVPSAL
jgi:hypothetical protein